MMFRLMNAPASNRFIALNVFWAAELDADDIRCLRIYDTNRIQVNTSRKKILYRKTPFPEDYTVAMHMYM